MQCRTIDEKVLSRVPVYIRS